MESIIVRNLQPEYEPVALVWSDSIPNTAFQFKEGKFGCTLYLFAVASRRRMVAGGSRDNITCIGGRAALGLGVDLDATDEILDRYAAVMSKGIKSANDRKGYRTWMEAAPANFKDLREYGERRHISSELAREWILRELPRYDIPYKYVLFEPLSVVSLEENIRAVIFPVNPVELAGLVTLAGSIMKGTDCVRVPQCADCYSITAFANDEEDSKRPRAVLGMMGVDGRKVMRKHFRDDILTLTLPLQLFQQMEKEADDCIFQIPSWKKLIEE